MASAPAQTMCPYCLAPLTTVAVSDEHVLPASLGGTETVPACREANSQIGHKLEGRLLGRHSWLTVMAQAAGYTDGWVDVRYPDGRRALEHFGAKRGMLLDPLVETVTETDEKRQIRMIVPKHLGEGFVEHVISQQAGVVERIDRGPAPEEWANVESSVHLDDLASLGAKVALCFGAARWGDDFLVSPLGGWLRPGVTDPAALAELAPPAGPSFDALRAVLDQAVGHKYGGQPVTGPWTPPVPPMLLLVPADAGRQTIITLVLFGLPVVTFGAGYTAPIGLQPSVNWLS